jgi:hypothetical protein
LPGHSAAASRVMSGTEDVLSTVVSEAPAPVVNAPLAESAKFQDPLSCVPT